MPAPGSMKPGADPRMAHLGGRVRWYAAVPGWAMLLAAAPLLWALSVVPGHAALPTPLFLFMHTAVELFCVVVAVLIFLTGYHTLVSMRSGAVMLLSVAFLGVGILDFLHAMSYLGMPEAFGPNTQDKSMLLWLVARSLAALALLLYVLMPAEPRFGVGGRRVAVAVLTAAVLLFFAVALSWPERMPSLYVPGRGLTRLKIGWEQAIIAVHLATLGALWAGRHRLGHDRIGALGLAVALSAVSELFFTRLGLNDQDTANALGHAYKAVAYLYLFWATVDRALRQPLHRLALQYQREKVSLNAAPDGILWVGADGRMLMVNPAMEAMSGYAESELVGNNISMFVPAHLRERHTGALRAYFHGPVARPMGMMDLTLQRRDGSLMPVDISLGHWTDEEGVPYAIAYIRNLTERRRFEESLRHQATHDELTGLPNRWLFKLQLEQTMTHALRSGTHVAVMFLDLDYFKTINDSFGHAAGDALLREAGLRIRRVLRAQDILARLGGDEFAILLADLPQPEDAFKAAGKMIEALHAGYSLHGHEVYSGASLGLAFFPGDAQDSETLLRYADLAMYQAKRAGRGVYACYSPELGQRVIENQRLHTRLKVAIAERALVLHYQPQVTFGAARVVGAEALLRWHDEVLGQVPPSEFIPIAEASGLMLELSEFVLDRVCAQIALWEAAGTPLRVAINFSAQQFNQPDLAERVAAALGRYGASAALLDVEITESVAMEHPEHARGHIDALAALGCTVALDDFGTGYSSLAYLRSLPVRVLKIDRSFVADLPHDASAAAISQAIIALAHTLGMTLVAEGVETPEQHDFLRDAGCEAYQGWLAAPAMPAEALGSMLAQQKLYADA